MAEPLIWEAPFVLLLPVLLWSTISCNESAWLVWTCIGVLKFMVRVAAHVPSLTMFMLAALPVAASTTEGVVASAAGTAAQASAAAATINRPHDLPTLQVTAPPPPRDYITLDRRGPCRLRSI